MLRSVDLNRGADHRFIFAVGDIHGRFDLLDRAVHAIREYGGDVGKQVVFLGDYIDRGPESSAVVDYLSTRSARRVTCLRGNHEQMLLSLIDDLDVRRFKTWLSLGGDQTLRSYGGKGTIESLEVIPERHLRWLKSLPHIALDDHRIYVHAGLMPGESFVDHTEDELLWIRERFLRAGSLSEFPDKRHIVHGHTPQWSGKSDPSAPELLDHRTNLDTGAYATGVLGVAVFDPRIAGGPIDLIAVRNSTVS